MKGVYSPKQVGQIVFSNNENLQQIILITYRQLNNAIQGSYKQKVLFRVLEVSQKIEKLVNKHISLKILNDLKAEIQILLEKEKNLSSEHILLQRLLIELQNKIIMVQKCPIKWVGKNIKDQLGDHQVEIYHSTKLQMYDLLKREKNQHKKLRNQKSKTQE
ncbi:unnamed protein product (macronuclear) [Paramecium tetraurelia]|uniref:Uncharacterized protein n=1 Tax=Paramecium tetraurelia TaxID=5888 RepID=A0CLW5_PARTE|nr:uncharacterized protein GSPATT00038707001 [Paramecium tetraurelia]CAK71782.1 unnamed protein product [Paramecium tetraurelia]|eukprot:XP_001439179.1 hypothetical protein (macronuclear) [Paramecium tetraurelia strain d4-2]